MDIRPLSRDEVRGIDARAADELGLPTLVLMENAGRGAAAWLRDHIGDPQGRPVLIACGRGNNGGDGGVVARHLDAWGFAVRVVWLARADGLAGEAAVQANILGKAGIEQIFPGPCRCVRSCRLRGDGRGSRMDRRWPARHGPDAAGRGGVARGDRGDQPLGAPGPGARPPLGARRRHRPPARRGRPARATATFVAPKLGFAAPARATTPARWSSSTSASRGASWGRT